MHPAPLSLGCQIQVLVAGQGLYQRGVRLALQALAHLECGVSLWKKPIFLGFSLRLFLACGYLLDSPVRP